MKFSTEQLINFWAFASMGALIFSAISLFFFRYYSGKKSQKNFTQIGTQITSEVNKAINEIDVTKETLKLKLNTEVESIINELKGNASSANSALEVLKSETSTLMNDVKNDLSTLREETQKTLEDLKSPIGTNFNLVAFKFKIGKDKLKNLEDKLIETGELDNMIKMLKTENTKVGSIGISQESTPSEIFELTKKFKWIRIRIVEKITDDINTSNQLLSIQFDKTTEGKISLSKQIDSNYRFKDFILSISQENIKSSDVKKSNGITSRNELCNKLVLIESAFSDFHPSTKPYNLEVADLYFTDNYLNAYQFIPVKNVLVGLFPPDIKNFESYKSITTMGILQCKNE